MSGGYLYGDLRPTEPCPYCGTTCEADFVDNGVGYVQCGPFHCTSCGASEIGPYDKKRPLSDDEKRTGWYGPNSEPGSSANVIGGKIVGYKEMELNYRARFYGHEDSDKPEVVQQWWEDIRK